MGACIPDPSWSTASTASHEHQVAAVGISPTARRQRPRRGRARTYACRGTALPQEERYVMTDVHIRSAQRRRRRWSPALVLVLLAGTVVLAACGGGSSSNNKAATAATSKDTGTTAAPAVKAPTRTPIKAMTITSLNSQGPVYPNIAITAQAYEKWINARGGIGGRPLSVEVCDEHGKPTDAAACARKAVSDKVTAVVGSFSF